jgi:uncharacterized Zn finger protein
VDEQSEQGKSLETQCRYCGGDERPENRKQSSQHYQIVVACAGCGGVFASISRN